MGAEKNKILTSEEISQFKGLFRKYCSGEIAAGHCSDDGCDLCYINKAYMEIFDSLADDSEEDDEHEVTEDETE